MLFIFVDMGQPTRVLNVILYPTPNSLMFWDMMVLLGYLVLNILIAYVTFTSEEKGVHPPSWIKPIIILSIPWAISIHTVTAFLYPGLRPRPEPPHRLLPHPPEVHDVRRRRGGHQEALADRHLRHGDQHLLRPGRADRK